MSEARRYEVKLVGHALDYPRVLADLKLLPFALRPLYRPRVVQSLYFDTHGGRALQENLAGLSERAKLRLRWYGEVGDVVDAKLERKRRVNGFGSKDVTPIDESLRIRGASKRALTEGLSRTLRDRAGFEGALDGQSPAQWVRYRRDYFLTHDGRLRVTVDRDLQAFDQRNLLRLSDRLRTPLPDLLIVEVKADESQRGLLELFTRELALRPSKCSKFVMASSPSEGPTPSSYD